MEAIEVATKRRDKVEVMFDELDESLVNHNDRLVMAERRLENVEILVDVLDHERRNPPPTVKASKEPLGVWLFILFVWTPPILVACGLLSWGFEHHNGVVGFTALVAAVILIVAAIFWIANRDSYDFEKRW